jgi:uncharacterized DUF497 family protein
MSFEWDPKKAKTNLEKHGISFESATEVWSDPNRIEAPADLIGREERLITVGETKAGLACVLFTYRKLNIRIISARKPRDYERRCYEESKN